MQSLEFGPRPGGEPPKPNGHDRDNDLPGFNEPRAGPRMSEPSLIRFAPIDDEAMVGITEMPGLGPAQLAALNDELSDHAFDERNRHIRAEIALQPEFRADTSDAQHDLWMARVGRLWTSRHVRVKADAGGAGGRGGGPSADAAHGDGPDRRFRLPYTEKVFVGLVTGLVVVSLAFLLYTGSQLILAERIFPGVKEWWQAALVTGSIQAGLLLVPLTLAKSITMSRAQLVFRHAVNAGAIGCAILFLYWLWEHGDISAVRHFNAHSGLVGLGDLAGFTLDLSHVELKARVIAILGEACGAVAVKLNIESMTGAHLGWRLVPNPERSARDDEVAKQRERVKECKRRDAQLALLASGYERARRLNRALARGYVESWLRDCDAEMHRKQRDLRRQVPPVRPSE